MKFRLIYKGNDVRLGVGEYVIGRSPECQIVLDDPLVSRVHALVKVALDTVHVEDMGSRNGVRINGRQITGATRLTPGDALEVGGHELVLVTGTSPQSDATTARNQTTGRDTLGTLGALADKAFALGNAREAERILRHYLERLLTQIEDGDRLDSQVIAKAVTYGCSLACGTRRGRWLGYVFEVCNAAKTEAPAEIIDKLYSAAARLEAPESRALAHYIASCRGRQDKMTPGQRFQLSRAEGLLRLLQA